MEIKRIKRPWDKPTKHGTRYNPDPFYQSTTWKRTKEAFAASYTITPDGKPLSNHYCYDCYVESKKLTPKHTIDHQVRIKDGGSRTDHSNLRSQCAHHHAIKSAKEGNELRRKNTTTK